MQTLVTSMKGFIRDEDGQAITEYAAAIAFVGVIVAIVFGLANGSLFVGISQSYSTIGTQLSQLNSYSSST